MRGHMHLLQDHPLALPQRATKIGISASRSSRPGTGSAKALSPAALVGRPKHPACLQGTRRTDQAGKSHPTASSDLQGAQTARAGGRPSILPAEPSLPPQRARRMPGRLQKPTVTRGRPSLSPGPGPALRASSLSGRGNSPGTWLWAPEGTREQIIASSQTDSGTNAMGFFQLSPPTVGGCPLASTAVSLSLKTG